MDSRDLATLWLAHFPHPKVVGPNISPTYPALVNKSTVQRAALAWQLYTFVLLLRIIAISFLFRDISR